MLITFSLVQVSDPRNSSEKAAYFGQYYLQIPKKINKIIIK